jgi:hypothetical protein
VFFRAIFSFHSRLDGGNVATTTDVDAKSIVAFAAAPLTLAVHPVCAIQRRQPTRDSNFTASGTES